MIIPQVYPLWYCDVNLTGMSTREISVITENEYRTYVQGPFIVIAWNVDEDNVPVLIGTDGINGDGNNFGMPYGLLLIGLSPQEVLDEAVQRVRTAVTYAQSRLG